MHTTYIKNASQHDEPVYDAKTHGYYFLRVTCEGRTTEVREPRFEKSCCLVFATYHVTTIWAIRTRKVERNVVKNNTKLWSSTHKSAR